MAVTVFDRFDAVLDQTMPSLSSALDPIEAKRQIRRVIRPGLPEGARVALRAIRVMRHKPGKRCLIEYDVKVSEANGGATKMTLIGKVRARRFGLADFRLLRKFWEAGWDDTSPDGLSVPQPVGAVPKFRMWLQRKIVGQSATELLAGPGGKPLAERIAEAAHKLHHSSVQNGRSHSMSDELRILRQCLDDVLQHEPNWTYRIDRLWRACQWMAHTTPETAPMPIHRDFYADQVIVSRNRIYLVDFDLYCSGDPALDMGNFIGHVTEYSLRTLGNPSGLSHVEQALENRFVELAGESIRPAVRAYTTLTLVRHVYLSKRFPQRRHLTERLLELCEQRLGLVADQPIMLDHEVSM
jgi:hypothetical protein